MGRPSQGSAASILWTHRDETTKEARRNRPVASLLIQAVALRNDDDMIRKLTSGKYRLYSRKKNPETGRRRNSSGTFATRAAAEKHERAVQYFKRGIDLNPSPKCELSSTARCPRTNSG